MKKRLLALALSLFSIAFSLAQRPELGVPVGHSGRILSIAFSPDGKYAASGSEDKSIRLWELADGKLIKAWEPYRDEVRKAPVFGVEFGVGGKYLLCGAGLTGSSIQSLEIGKVGGDNLRVFVDPSVGLAAVQPPVAALAMSPVGEEVLSLTANNELKLWNLRTGKLVRTFAKQPEQITSLAISADGKWAYSGNSDGSVQRWDVLKGQPDFLFKNIHTAQVNTLSLSKNGQMVLSGSEQGGLKLWKMVDNAAQTIFEFKDSYSPDHGLTAVFSPNDSLVAYGASDNSVVLWDIATKVATDRMAGHEQEVSALRFSPDGTKLITGSFDNSLIVWDIATGKQVLALNGYSRIIKQVFFSPNKKYAVAVPEFDERIVVWDTEGGGVKRAFLGHQDNVIAACVSPKGKYLLSSGDDLKLILWDFETAKRLTVLTGHNDFVNCMAISHDEKLAITGSDDNSVILWDLETRTPLKTFNDHVAKVTAVAFSPDGLMAMTGADDNTVKVYDVAQRKLMANIPGQATRWSPVTFSPDGKSFLSISCESFKIEWWDIAERKLKKEFDLTTPTDKPGNRIYCGSPSRTAFSPDGSRFLFASGNDVLLWDLDEDNPTFLRGHKAPVKTVAFSPDGKLAISAGYDGSVKMWDGRTGEALCTVFHINQKDWVAITPAGLFDASPAAMKSMYFVVGLETIELEQLKERYYEPDLLPILLGFKKGSLRQVDALGELALYPELVAEIKGEKLVIALKKRTGGFGKVSVAINGSEVLADACGGKVGCTVGLDELKNHFYSADSLLAQNTITVRAYNEEGWLKSPELVLHPFAKKSRGDDESGGDDELSFQLRPDTRPKPLRHRGGHFRLRWQRH
ncbi:MAG: hypothetical protein IPM82_16265 [Saprospiraceae bacterium]|nr:hypothetical protein [Saprospiraceae bacterium]